MSKQQRNFPDDHKHHSCEPPKLKKSLWVLCTKVSKDKHFPLSKIQSPKASLLVTSVCKEILKENTDTAVWHFLLWGQFLVIKLGKTGICVYLLTSILWFNPRTVQEKPKYPKHSEHQAGRETTPRQKYHLRSPPGLSSSSTDMLQSSWSWQGVQIMETKPWLCPAL